RLTYYSVVTMTLAIVVRPPLSFPFFFPPPPPPPFYTLSLHDALPISPPHRDRPGGGDARVRCQAPAGDGPLARQALGTEHEHHQDRKSTRLNSSHVKISYAVFCLKKKKKIKKILLLQ